MAEETIQVEGRVVERAVLAVEKMLKDAVESSTDQASFMQNLHYCQLVGQRLFALLVYNACVNDLTKVDEQLERVVKGVRHELSQIIESSKDKKNMSVVDKTFGDA